MKILYILGIGHSGTTLLELILSSSSKCFSVGEYKYIKCWQEEEIKHRKVKHDVNFLCSCGKKINNCEFWKDILRNNEKNLYEIEKSSINKIKYIFNINRNFKQYNDKLIFSSILDKINNSNEDSVDYIVDSSKDLSRLIYLREQLKLDVEILYIVRDGRAVINSHEKTGFFWLSTYFKWLIGNILIRRYLKKIPQNKVLYLSYDKLSNNPKKLFEILNSKYNLGISYSDFLNNSYTNYEHSIGGNIMRNKKITSIKQNTSWKNNISKSKKIILNILCYLPNKLWVYK